MSDDDEVMRRGIDAAVTEFDEHRDRRLRVHEAETVLVQVLGRDAASRLLAALEGPGVLTADERLALAELAGMEPAAWFDPDVGQVMPAGVEPADTAGLVRLYRLAERDDREAR